MNGGGSVYPRPYAATLGKPLVILHPEEHTHALEELDAAALAVAERPDQVVKILRYVLTGALDSL